MSGEMRLTIVFLCAGAAVAQQTGTVAGHVYCADTNLPARFASISLEPVEIGPERLMNGHPTTPTVKVVQTGLDGGFSVGQIKPGTYYVVVQKLRYLQPILGFSRSDLEKPTAAMAQRIAKAVPTVTVGAGQTASVEVRIERGAAMSGRVIFDDGSPAADVMVMVLRRRADGIWNSVERSGNDMHQPLMRTDDQGRFRIVDLPPGEFLLQVEFQIMESMKGSMFDSGGGFASGGGGMNRLTVYAGNVFREAQATRIKLAAGEDRSGEEIVVPLAKLHTVSGGLVNNSGAVVNGGVVVLYAAEEKVPAALAVVSTDTGLFHFPFVPEGTYRLEAVGMDTILAELPAREAAALGVATQPKPVRMYGWRRQPLVVENDVTGLMVTVPDATAKTVAAQ